MIYLLLAIICSAMVAITMRIGKTYCKNEYSMLVVNYVCCTIFAVITTGAGGFALEKTSISLGITQGVLYLVSLIAYQYNIKSNGVVLSTTFMKLGVLVPTLAAIFLFGEQPTWVELVGVVLSITAIIYINMEKGTGQVPFKKALIILLVLGGTTDIMAKVYEQYGNASFKNQFIFYTFATAMILCIAFARYNKQGLERNDILCGIAIGVPNFFCAVFLLRALSFVLATIAYSTYSVATIACTTIAGVIFFKEKLSKRQIVGLAIILVALVCLNF